MHKTIRNLTIVSLSLLFLSLPLSAQGVKDGTGPIHVKEAFTYAGTIIDCLRGDGITVATGDYGNIVIYGIGPESFWEAYGGKPGVGEWITVEGFTVVYNGEERNIAWTVTLSDLIPIPLRDDAGLPLWRSGGQFGGAGSRKGNGHN